MKSWAAFVNRPFSVLVCKAHKGFEFLTIPVNQLTIGVFSSPYAMLLLRGVVRRILTKVLKGFFFVPFILLHWYRAARRSNGSNHLAFIVRLRKVYCNFS